MTISFVATPQPLQIATPALSGLTPEQLTALDAAVRHQVGELSVQFRHATPFSPLRQALRDRLAVLRAVLVQGDVARANAPTVTAVLAGRIEVLREQRRHCDRPAFAADLLAEQATLGTIVDQLGARYGG